jgi:nitroreductase
MDAIYKRRAMRLFQKTPVGEDLLRKLLDAAVQAPSARNLQPWAFVIIEGTNVLKEYSDRAKRFLLGSLDPESPLHEFRESLADREFNIFYDAGTLVVVCAKNADPQAGEDCCLAAENFMLAALEFGLATCPIGLARPWLNAPEVKRELHIPAAYTPVMPIIVGYPTSAEATPVTRTAPEILTWKRTPVTEPVHAG